MRGEERDERDAGTDAYPLLEQTFIDADDDGGWVMVVVFFIQESE